MLVLVAPGQGAQKPGLLTPWLELPGAADRLAEWSAAIDFDLVHYGTEADADAIRDTAVAQPLLVAAGLLSAEVLLDRRLEEAAGADGPLRAVGAVAGHSVGELVAAALAGVLTPETALRLVRTRGRVMAEAAGTGETGMSAVLGGDPEVVLAHLAKLDLVPANQNGAGQIVAAGSSEALAALAADRPDKARVVALKVAGAFHTDHMAPASSAMEEAVEGVRAGDPDVRYVSNLDGRTVESGPEVVRRLVHQISAPVRWDLCMETFEELGVTTLIELCPGGTLTGLAKRAMPDVRRLALKTPGDLDPARELLAEHLPS
ncbi:acyltransferase domain-containing protein [Streptomyces boncukensis]|uniref:Malonyl CoA-acyl carrier protein transacylase n=1 Tax=Streptomyces boncukensis TaxID=2711219 RepID=A0A6G4WUF6_9ACTN|nr:ACP S-malonyltransferase [Streptomyces boncukensis]